MTLMPSDSQGLGGLWGGSDALQPIRGPQGQENTFRWATVATVEPLGIILDGDTAPLPMVPENLVSTALTVGQRVWTQLFGRRVIVIGAPGGGVTVAHVIRNIATVQYPESIPVSATQFNLLNPGGGLPDRRIVIPLEERIAGRRFRLSYTTQVHQTAAVAGNPYVFVWVRAGSSASVGGTNYGQATVTSPFVNRRVGVSGFAELTWPGGTLNPDPSVPYMVGVVIEPSGSNSAGCINGTESPSWVALDAILEVEVPAVGGMSGGGGGGPSTPTGPAGGDLTGTYPDPQIANGAVGSAEIDPVLLADMLASAFEVADEGTSLIFSPEKLDFVGAGVEVTATGPDGAFASINIPGGGIMGQNIPRTDIITASGTWTKPAGALYCRVRVVGGGGAGGGAPVTAASQQSSGAGGGSGGYVEKRFLASALGATEAIVIGAAGAAASGATGGNGGASSFGAGATLLTGGGGGGGVTEGAATTIGSNATGGTGGTAAGGEINIVGEPGEMSARTGSATGNPDVGNGGSNPLGSGGRGIGASAAGLAGNGYGGGGGGAGNAQSQAARLGGAGAPGVVIIDTYFSPVAAGALDIQTGLVNSGVLVAGTPTTVPVVFPVPFPAAGPVPRVTATLDSVLGAVNVFLGVSAVTRTGFNITFRRDSSTFAMDAHWHAIGGSSFSSGGLQAEPSWHRIGTSQILVDGTYTTTFANAGTVAIPESHWVAGRLFRAYWSGQLVNDTAGAYTEVFLRYGNNAVNGVNTQQFMNQVIDHRLAGRRIGATLLGETPPWPLPGATPGTPYNIVAVLAPGSNQSRYQASAERPVTLMVDAFY